MTAGARCAINIAAGSNDPAPRIAITSDEAHCGPAGSADRLQPQTSLRSHSASARTWPMN
jgi:hypothetical protein